jgi:hypothetical protein
MPKPDYHGLFFTSSKSDSPLNAMKAEVGMWGAQEAGASNCFRAELPLALTSGISPGGLPARSFHRFYDLGSVIGIHELEFVRVALSK